MTRQCPPTVLRAVAAAAALVATALPAAAQGNDALLQEIKALRDRVEQLERQVRAQPAAPKPGEWGMTPEQARELNRIAVKTEALQDNFTDQGIKGLKITGQIDPTYIVNRRQNDRTFVFLNNGGARYTYDNGYFGMAVIDFEKETESGARWKLTLAPERGTGALANGGSIVHEASVSIPGEDSRRATPLPSALIRNSCEPPSRVSVTASCLPSGDHAGALLLPRNCATGWRAPVTSDCT